MKKLMAVLVTTVALVLGLGLVGCNEEKEPEYIPESEIGSLFVDANDYKGKYVVITGKVFNKVESSDGMTVWQAYYDSQNYTDSFAFSAPDDVAISTDDYVKVDGEIESMVSATNAFGGDISFPMIRSVSVDVLSYIDAVAPTIATSTPESASITQGDIVLSVDKVEFADNETRVYLTETNNSSSSFSLYTYSAKVIQNGQQVDQDSMSSSTYEGHYPQLSTNLTPGASSSGIIVFPPLESSAPFQLILEGYSDDMIVGDFGQLSFTFDIPATN